MNTLDNFVYTPINHTGVFTNTLIIAKHFKKQHYRITSIIERHLKNSSISHSDLRVSHYKNERGKTYKMFELNQKAFLVVVLSFTGADADRLKGAFVDKFLTQNEELKIWRERRNISKQETKSANDNVKLLSERLKQDAPDSSKGARVFLHVQQKINAVISGSCKSIERDTLNDTDLELINKLENTTHKLIGMMLDTFGSIVTRVHLLSLLECYKNNKRLISY